MELSFSYSSGNTWKEEIPLAILVDDCCSIKKEIPLAILVDDCCRIRKEFPLLSSYSLAGTRLPVTAVGQREDAVKEEWGKLGSKRENIK